MPKTEASYKVAHTQVGPWPQGHVFTDKEFARLHPLPDNPQTRDAGLTDDGPEAYQEGLLRRLLDAGAVVPAEAGTPADPTPIGPENKVAPPKPREGTTPAPLTAGPLKPIDPVKTEPSARK